MTQEIDDAQMRTAMKDPNHLKRFLHASGREYLVLRTDHLVDALWAPGMPPDGIEALQQIIAAYRDHRRAIPSGWVAPAPQHKEPEVLMLSDQLSVDELEMAIGFLQRSMSERTAELKALGAVRAP